MTSDSFRSRFARVHRDGGRGYVPRFRFHFIRFAFRLATALLVAALLIPAVDLIFKGEYALKNSIGTVPWAFGFTYLGVLFHAHWNTRKRRGDPYRFSVSQFRFFKVPEAQIDRMSIALLRAGFDSEGAEPVPDGTQEIYSRAIAGNLPIRFVLRMIAVPGSPESYVTIEIFSYRSNFGNAVHAMLETIAGLEEFERYRTGPDFELTR